MQMWLAGGILVAAYVLIFSDWIHRTSAAVIGAVVMVAVGMAGGFYTQEQALRAIDGNTILLLLSMMMVVAMLRPTGAFEYLAIWLARRAGYGPRRLFIYLCTVVSLLSMVLDNVTTIIIFAPLTILITRMLRLNPAPYLMAEAMLSNIGGASTLVGDPPNIMIGSAASFDFTQFLLNMGPVILPAWVGTMALLLFRFRHDLIPMATHPAIMDLDESQAIRDPAGLRRVLWALGFIIVAFFIHHHLHLYPAFVGFAGLALALLLVRPNPEPLFGEVAWSVLLFFSSLFVIVGGVEHSGLLAMIGDQLMGVALEPGMMLLTAILLIWLAAVLSAVVDNIPFTVAMIPIIASLQHQGVAVEPLWWALAIGVGLGGNGTHIGATANIICVAESEKTGHPESVITPMGWLRHGLPVTLISLVIASLVFAFIYSV